MKRLILFSALVTLITAVYADVNSSVNETKEIIIYENEWVCGGTLIRVDKQALVSDIKKIIRMVFFDELAIKSGNFSDMAQGNADLALDLKELFCVSFNDSEIAQKMLDEFCGKWNLEKIKISDAHLF